MTKLALIVFVIVFGGQVTAQICHEEQDEVVFIGTVKRVSPGPVVLSGDIPSYRLVKYRINRVLVGEFFTRDIVVDHLILTGRELDGVKVGDKLKVRVRKVTSIDVRTNFTGIRERAEKVETYFIAEEFEKNARVTNR